KLQETRQVLTERVREPFNKVVWLSDVCGYRYKEIVTELGIPLGTVMSQLHRGRQQLYAAMNGEQLFLRRIVELQ
ncbi:MAG: sigma factor-like helix-turn-helix DNA-binding protein, partial [Nanoarchaeota archaeon]